MGAGGEVGYSTPILRARWCRCDRKVPWLEASWNEPTSVMTYRALSEPRTGRRRRYDLLLIDEPQPRRSLCRKWWPWRRDVDRCARSHQAGWSLEQRIAMSALTAGPARRSQTPWPSPDGSRPSRRLEPSGSKMEPRTARTVRPHHPHYLTTFSHTAAAEVGAGV